LITSSSIYAWNAHVSAKELFAREPRGGEGRKRNRKEGKREGGRREEKEGRKRVGERAGYLKHKNMLNAVLQNFPQDSPVTASCAVQRHSIR